MQRAVQSKSIVQINETDEQYHNTPIIEQKAPCVTHFQATNQHPAQRKRFKRHTPACHLMWQNKRVAQSTCNNKYNRNFEMEQKNTYISRTH